MFVCIDWDWLSPGKNGFMEFSPGSTMTWLGPDTTGLTELGPGKALGTVITGLAEFGSRLHSPATFELTEFGPSSDWLTKLGPAVGRLELSEFRIISNS